MFVHIFPALVVDRIGWLLVHSIWQFALIALATAFMLRAMQDARANVRYGICLLGWTAIAIAPLVTWMSLPPYIPAAATIDRHPAVVADAPPTPIDLSAPSKVPHDASIFIPDSDPAMTAEPDGTLAESAVPWWGSLEARIAPWLEDLVAIWFVGVVLFGLRPGIGWYMTWRLRRSGLSPVPAEVTAALERESRRLGIRQQVRIWQSTLAKVPLVVGYLRPLILLPVCVVSGLSVSQVEAILAHELAHIRRHDYLVNLLQTLIETVFFYHPAVWWLSSRLRHEREHCCDELAAQTLGSRADYGRALLALEELRGSMPVLSLGATGGSLGERIRRLALANTNRESFGASGIVFMASLLILFGGIGIWTATRAEQVSSAATAQQAGSETAEQAQVEAQLPDNVTAPPQNADVAQQDPSAELPPEGVVQGVLVDANGSPVTGARIILRSSRAYYAESDANGTFLLENIPANPREYLIWAHAGNLVTAKVQLEQSISDESGNARFAPLRLEMREGKRAKFVVTSARTAEPLESAVIRFGYPDRRRVETAADGTAVVQGLLAEEYDVTIESEGHARQAPQIDLTSAPATTQYTAALEPGGIVRGVVVDEQGQPVSAATVVYRIGSGVGFYGDDYRTGADGRFQNRFLPFNTAIEVSIRRDGYIEQEKEVILSTNNRGVDIQFALKQRPSGGSVAGIVKDHEDNPLQGAEVASLGNRSADKRETVTDAEGEFTLHDLFEGYTGYSIQVSAPGFAPQRIPVEPGTAGSPSHVSVNLELGHTIRGRIVDENARPIQGAFVTTRSEVYGMGGLGTTVRTREDGTFAFDSLPADVRFDVSHPDYPSLFSEPLQLDSDDAATVMLEAPGMIHGRVIDAETKQPVPQLRIQVGFSRMRKPSDPKGTFSGSWSDPGITFNSDEGEFVIKPLTDGFPAELVLFADGYERQVIPRTVAAKGDQAEALIVPLKRIETAEQFTLTAQLVDYAGQPIRGAHLRLIVSTDQPTGSDDNRFNWVLVKGGDLAHKSYSEQFLSGVTDSDGRFEFKNVLPGKYLQLAYWGNGVPQGRSLAFDETRAGASDSVVIKVPQPARVRGTIDRSKFPTAGSVRLSLQQSSWQDYTIELEKEQTEFTFDDLPPGEYSVAVVAKPVPYTENGHQFFRLSPLASQRIELEAGQIEEVSFTEPNIANQ